MRSLVFALNQTFFLTYERRVRVLHGRVDLVMSAAQTGHCNDRLIDGWPVVGRRTRPCLGVLLFQATWTGREIGDRRSSDAAAAEAATETG